MSAARTLLVQVFSWTLMLSVIAGAAALIVIPKVSEARPLTVLSGSMEPTYDPGDVVIVQEADPENLTVGDVITFQAVSDDPQLTTHRIVGITFGGEGRTFVTQGDNNNAPDLSPVLPEQVRGEVWYSVPLVGHVSVWMAGDWVGTALDALALGLMLYGGFAITSAWLERRRTAADEPSQAAADDSPSGIRLFTEVSV